MFYVGTSEVLGWGADGQANEMTWEGDRDSLCDVSAHTEEPAGWVWCVGPGEGLEGPQGRDTPGHTHGVSSLWALSLGPQASTCPSSNPPQMGPGPSRRDPPQMM